MPKVIEAQLREWNKYFYKCTSCGAEDSNTEQGGNQPISALNCYKCKGKDTMGLLSKPPESHGEIWTG